LKAYGLDGFGEVVDGAYGKGFDGELIVSCDEDGWGHVMRTNCVDDVEAADAGHLDVEQEKIGGRGFQTGDGLSAISAFGDYFDLFILSEEELEPFACERLIIGHDGFELHAGSRS
jgi:hypothetical protein